MQSSIFPWTICRARRVLPVSGYIERSAGKAEDSTLPRHGSNHSVLLIAPLLARMMLALV